MILGKKQLAIQALTQEWVRQLESLPFKACYFGCVILPEDDDYVFAVGISEDLNDAMGFGGALLALRNIEAHVMALYRKRIQDRPRLEGTRSDHEEVAKPEEQR